MATTRRLFVLAAGFLSALAAILTFTSMGTEYWVVSEPIWKTDNTNKNKVHYGLFKGIFRNSMNMISIELTMTCSYSDNACALLCYNSGNDDVLQNLINGKDIDTFACTTNYKLHTLYHNVGDPDEEKTRTFFNSGVRVSTLLFMFISAAFGLLAAALSVYNTASNPIEVYMGITGLYIYNAVAFCCSLIYILIYGIYFQISLYHDIYMTLTIIGEIDSDSRSVLGYSYWINLGTLVLYAGSLVILYLRNYLISKDPPKRHIELEETDLMSRYRRPI